MMRQKADGSGYLEDEVGRWRGDPLGAAMAQSVSFGRAVLAGAVDQQVGSQHQRVSLSVIPTRLIAVTDRPLGLTHTSRSVGLSMALIFHRPPLVQPITA